MRTNVPSTLRVQEPLALQEKTDIPSESLMRKSFTSTFDNFVATVILESKNDNHCSNQLRLNTLKTVLSNLAIQKLKSGIAVFPAGMFCTVNEPPCSIYLQIETEISSFLSSIENRIVVCFGIDGSNARDQIAVAVDRTGIIALGRKFHPTKEEEKYVKCAKNFNALENGKSRIFNFGDSSFYLGVCYDVFGIKNPKIKNPGVSGFIDLAHCFYPRERRKLSGESYFAHYGFAGAARQWNCAVYGSAVFFDRKVPEHWPSGVIWDKDLDKSLKAIQKWKYSNNKLKPVNVEQMNIDEGKAVVRLFPMP